MGLHNLPCIPSLVRRGKISIRPYELLMQRSLSQAEEFSLNL
jgi:hypothetical protein